jgi:branched-chain amino acid transport system substrate-binding protein
MVTFLPQDPKFPGGAPYTVVGQFFKSIGATNVGEVASATPSSAGAANATKISVLAAGLKNTYINTNVPFGGVDFTADMLAMKSQGVDGAECVCVESSDIALATAAKNAGINLKQYFATGYDQQTLDDPEAVAAAQGQYFGASVVPFELKTPATVNMLDAMKKYVGYTGTVPDFGQLEGWLAADLMITGLQGAGSNPTRESLLNALRADTAYTGGGLLPSPVDLSLSAFGKVPTTTCQYYVQMEGKAFVPLPKRCGTLIGTP